MATDVLVSLDAFPAKVVYPSGQSIEPVRAVIADGQLLVYQAGGTEPRLILQRDVISTEGQFRSGLAVQVWDGITMVGAARGCGCGSSLRNADLWPGRRRINVPL